MESGRREKNKRLNESWKKNGERDEGDKMEKRQHEKETVDKEFRISTTCTVIVCSSFLLCNNTAKV